MLKGIVTYRATLKIFISRGIFQTYYWYLLNKFSIVIRSIVIKSDNNSFSVSTELEVLDLLLIRNVISWLFTTTMKELNSSIKRNISN